MCLAAPMELVSLDGADGVAESGGVRYAIRLDLLESPRVGDYVLVHAGYAIQQLDADSARETLALLAEVVAAADPDADDDGARDDG